MWDGGYYTNEDRESWKTAKVKKSIYHPLNANWVEDRRQRLPEQPLGYLCIRGELTWHFHKYVDKYHQYQLPVENMCWFIWTLYQRGVEDFKYNLKHHFLANKSKFLDQNLQPHKNVSWLIHQDDWKDNEDIWTFTSHVYTYKLYQLICQKMCVCVCVCWRWVSVCG